MNHMSESRACLLIKQDEVSLGRLNHVLKEIRTRQFFVWLLSLEIAHM